MTNSICFRILVSVFVSILMMTIISCSLLGPKKDLSTSSVTVVDSTALDADTALPVNSPEICILEVRKAFVMGDADLFKAQLSKETIGWMERMTNAVYTEDETKIAARPFFEIMTILSLRHHWREQGGSTKTLDDGLKEMVTTSFIRNSFTNFELGPIHTDQRDAWIGLEKTPNTPVFFMVKENQIWKLDLVPTLPLLLKGIESRFVQKYPVVLDRAFAILKFTARGINRDELLKL